MLYNSGIHFVFICLSLYFASGWCCLSPSSCEQWCMVTRQNNYPISAPLCRSALCLPEAVATTTNIAQSADRLRKEQGGFRSFILPGSVVCVRVRVLSECSEHERIREWWAVESIRHVISGAVHLSIWVSEILWGRSGMWIPPWGPEHSCLSCLPL